MPQPQPVPAPMLDKHRKHWITYFTTTRSILTGDDLPEELFPRVLIPPSSKQTLPLAIAFGQREAPDNAQYFFLTKADLPSARTGNIRVAGPFSCR